MRETRELKKVATFLCFLLPKRTDFMEVRIQIPDAVYTQLLQGNKRIAGSLVLDNPLQGNFRAYNRAQRRKTVKQSMKLPHGRVSMNDTNVSMYLKIAYTESLSPARTIEAESGMASSFIDLITELN